VLRRNFLYGEESLKLANTFLFAYYLARSIFYVFLYGQFQLDLAIFVGLVGLSISINHGVREPSQAPADEAEVDAHDPSGGDTQGRGTERRYDSIVRPPLRDIGRMSHGPMGRCAQAWPPGAGSTLPMGLRSSNEADRSWARAPMIRACTHRC